MTDKLRAAAEMALEALETLDVGDSYKTHSAASALRQALAEPPNSTTDVVEAEEPLCYLQETDTLGGGYEQVIWGEGFPVYTALQKREWQGLTDEEIEEGYEKSWVESKQAWESAVWWAEAKLKDKNT